MAVHTRARILRQAIKIRTSTDATLRVDFDARPKFQQASLFATEEVRSRVFRPVRVHVPYNTGEYWTLVQCSIPIVYQKTSLASNAIPSRAFASPICSNENPEVAYACAYRNLYIERIQNLIHGLLCA